ncbi:MAG: molybdopterin molybdotransferase MoeA [Pyrinomonadaceae bacterium]|nr:molybdopterin molybdotransferase MoeA [Phycisphaerales bacterium]
MPDSCSVPVWQNSSPETKHFIGEEPAYGFRGGLRMSFGGRAYAMESPGAAVAAMIARLQTDPLTRSVERCEPGSAREVMGRVLAEPVVADRDSPAFEYSAMDGYAARLSDVANALKSQPQPDDDSVTLPVLGEARIGFEPPPMPQGNGVPGVVRIATGAGLPPGADVVIRREDVLEHPGSEGGPSVGSITIARSNAARLRSGDFIRRRGENTRAGTEVLSVGTVLNAAAMGTLAAVGCVRPRVYARLRVAIIVTGDELVPPSANPGPFQIRNSNETAISALLAPLAWIKVASELGAHVQDDGQQLSGVLRDAIAGADAVILSGGVSMGHHDPVRRAIESAGAEVVFHGLPQRPGKPILGAVAMSTGGRRVPVFGLPGNPISAMVTCLRIVVPTLAACACATRRPAPLRIALASPDGKTVDVWWHRLVRLDEQGRALLVDGRGSGDIIAAGQSDGFIEVPPQAAGADGFPPSLYPFYPWPS